MRLLCYFDRIPPADEQSRKLDWGYLIVIGDVMHTLSTTIQLNSSTFLTPIVELRAGPVRGGDRRAAHW